MKYISLALFILVGALNAATITVPTVVDATHISTTAPITVTSANTANTIVYRDASANVALGIITGATWNGNAVGIAYGGTGQTTRQAALNALCGLVNKGEILYHNGTNVTTLSAGTSGYVLTADATVGVKWAAVSGGGGGGSVDTSADYTWTGTQTWQGGNLFTTSGTYLHLNWDNGTGGLNGKDSLGNLAFGILPAAGTIKLQNAFKVSWSSDEQYYSSNDISLSRNTAGVLEITNASTGGGALRFHDMTAPSTPSDGGIIYAASGELHAMDNSGHDTVFSPHPTDAPPAMYTDTPGVEQFNKSINWYTGEIRWKNVDAGTPLVRETFAAYNARFGYQEGDAGYLKSRDWDADQQKFSDDRAAQIAAQAKRQTDAATVLANPQATKQQQDEAQRVVNEPALAPYVKKANPYK